MQSCADARAESLPSMTAGYQLVLSVSALNKWPGLQIHTAVGSFVLSHGGGSALFGGASVVEEVAFASAEDDEAPPLLPLRLHSCW